MNNDKCQLKARLEAYFDEHFDEIINDLSQIMSIDSSLGSPLDGKPFGEGSARALEWGAAQGKSLGLSVKNFDNYAVSLTYGDTPVLGILSHLDTVPVKRSDNSDEWIGWKHEPFACTVEDGVIYGRGAIDDKGPSAAVLWAVRALFELGEKPQKGFRIIFGGNEEGGCEDIAYYEKLEAFPPMLFTPDGSFPVLNCEKGMVHITFSAPYENGGYFPIRCGDVINAVPELCKAINAADGSEEIFEGKASHGSRPENGDNALTKFLDKAAKAPGAHPLIKALNRLFPHGEFDGASCGFGFSDEISGKMTCALTMLNTAEGRLCGGADIRFPIDRTYEEISGIITDKLEQAGFFVDECSGMQPHYVPADSELVRTLLDVYELATGKKGEPIAEGGITYVHNTEGGVAFGAEFPWENNNMHGAEEHISVQTLKLNMVMYALAIAELCG